MEKIEYQRRIAQSLMTLHMELPIISTITKLSIEDLKEISKNVDLK